MQEHWSVEIISNHSDRRKKERKKKTREEIDKKRNWEETETEKEKMLRKEKAEV